MREIEIENYDISTLERLHFDVNARTNIINMLIRNNLMDNDFFRNTCKEYLTLQVLYEKEKDKFNTQVVKKLKTPEEKSWSINFEDKILCLDTNEI